MNAHTKTETIESYRDGWMQTLGGHQFYPLAPEADQIRITDIAGALAKMCRYGGHCCNFYSVAEHSVLAARAIKDPALKLTMLMHDASEAYISDIIRPLKPHLTGYYAHEAKLMEIISAKYGLIWPLPDEVKRMDLAMLTDERRQNMAPMTATPQQWGDTEPSPGVELRFWVPGFAEFEFLKAFREFGGVA